MFLDKLFIASQYLVPQHWLSRLVGKAAETKLPWLKNLIIRAFIRQYEVNMSEAVYESADAYDNFNAFFTRALKPGCRPIDDTPGAVVCPADGAISEIGSIEDRRLLQAKGRYYNLETLLGGDHHLANEFQQGSFATVYLSPKDYHRVHMPYAGTLRKTIYVPGELFSVNNTTAANVPDLFARNERLICIFDTDIGPMAVILVGAMIVAGIETVFNGQVAPVKPVLHSQNYPQQVVAPQFEKGDELGRFKLGSTAIVLFGKDQVHWLEQFQHGTATRMGQQLGQKS